MGDKTFRKTVIILISSLLVLSLIFIYAKILTSGINTELMNVSNIEVTKDKVHITGDVDAKHKKGFYGFSYHYEKDVMILKPRYFWLNDRHFDILITKGMMNTRQIYFQGETEGDLKLIWEKP